ncbi:17-beta-hydroxysteroid dehydrogenase type 6 [Biomphalaria glabrata]|uniref:Uncharacterized protein n=1 Tax=Biomphalaria glabrata TaxID=6526 RepID=A0A2C9JUS9_BIOGL|nr:17-beta-hydroxysteroid dehydrogenase type 6 [Biomphalaria glabrata]
MICIVAVFILTAITYYIFDYLLRRLKVGGYHTKHVLVTGCDSGFGQRTVIRLDNLGFKVFAGCLTEDGRQYLSKNCSGNVVPFLLDVRSDKSIQSALDLVKQNLPENTGLWGLVNNAGILFTMAPTEFCTKSEYQRSMDVNLFGLIEMTRSFLPLIRKGQGRIINTTSWAGRLACMAPVYALSKYGVEAYSDILRREMYTTGIKVSIVEPGAFTTSIITRKQMLESVHNAYARIPEDIQSVYKVFVENFMNRILLDVVPPSSNLDLVVDAYIHGLTSRFPRTRYTPGNDSKFLYIPLSYLPTCLADWILKYNLK